MLYENPTQPRAGKRNTGKAMKKLIIISLAVFLSACDMEDGKVSVVTAKHAALVLSACQPLGAEPRYIYSQPLVNGDTQVAVKCTSDITVTLVIPKTKQDVKDI